MKLCLAAVLLAVAVSVCDAGHRSVALNANSITADSKLGMKLLSQARRLEEEGEDDKDDEDDRDDGEESEDRNEDEEDNNEEEDGDDEGEENDDNNNGGGDVTWVAGFSLKFQGCHNIKQWNADVDGDDDVRVMTKRLVRFRLCPTSSCSETVAGGCKSGYGDYIIDMNTYVYAYYEAKKDNCENYLANTCGCDDDADCEYNCFSEAGMYMCIDNDEGGVSAEDYLECAQLADNENYYVGPYCADQGGVIRLGMFTDDTCTESAEGVTFESITGYQLPYESQSIVGAECMSCAEMADGDNGDADEDADGTSEMCEAIYVESGKCEENLPSGTTDDPVNTGCNYMAGIKIARSDGIIMGGQYKKSPAATAFIVIFALLFCTIAFYVWYLRRRLGVKKTSLL
jgi:hypothetical protein